MRIFDYKNALFCVILLPFLFGFTQVHIMGNNGVGNCIKGDNNVVSSMRAVKNFKDVKIEGAFEVTITAGNTQPKIIITTDKNLSKYITTEIDQEELLISVNKAICSEKPVKIQLDASAIQRLTTDGASDIVLAKINNKKLSVQSDGSGTINISGVTSLLTADLNGSGELNAKLLKAQSVIINTGGATTAKITVVKELQAFADGASEVIYFGHPKLLKKEAYGAAEISGHDDI